MPKVDFYIGLVAEVLQVHPEKVTPDLRIIARIGLGSVMRTSKYGFTRSQQIDIVREAIRIYRTEFQDWKDSKGSKTTRVVETDYATLEKNFSRNHMGFYSVDIPEVTGDYYKDCIIAVRHCPPESVTTEERWAVKTGLFASIYGSPTPLDSDILKIVEAILYDNDRIRKESKK